LDRASGGEGWLEGVLLVVDESAHLDDRVAWFVRNGPAGKVPSRTVLFGRVSDADWAGVVEVLAAVVAWGDWTAPERLAPIAWDADRTSRRQLRKGCTRIVEEAGAMSNVVVLDARVAHAAKAPVAWLFGSVDVATSTAVSSRQSDRDRSA
jgi:hypothetical protein